ncbi:MAG: hypothetical protein J7K49_06280 [Thaumarchaeota archaeon]|nr:hypothetical protein [Nitrososphaerota archaeon]
MMLRVIFGYDIVMEIISSAVAFIISYYAYRAYSVTKKKSFLLLQLGFTFAGLGLLLDSMLVSAAIALRVLHLTATGYTLYFIATIIAYGFILGSYAADRLEPSEGHIASILPLIGFGALPEGILLTLAAAVTIQLGLNFFLNRSIDKFLVLIAFIFIVFGHLFFMLQAIRFAGFLIAGHVFRFLGFASFLVFVLRVVKSS